jgi:hypothetical protein
MTPGRGAISAGCAWAGTTQRFDCHFVGGGEQGGELDAWIAERVLSGVATWDGEVGGIEPLVCRGQRVLPHGCEVALVAGLGVAEVRFTLGVAADDTDSAVAERDEVVGRQFGGSEIVDAEGVRAFEGVADCQNRLVHLVQTGEFVGPDFYGGRDEGVDSFAQEKLVEDGRSLVG